MSPNRSQALESELQRLLIRHLPGGLEGIGVAQTTAVINLLNRFDARRGREPVDETQRQGMRLLAEEARSHASTVSTTRKGILICGRCLSPHGQNQAWPCSVWESAELLGLVDPDESPDRPAVQSSTT